MKALLLALAGLAGLAGTPGAAAPAAAPEVRIPFPDRGGIRNFHAESEDVLYIQDRHRRWYRADLVGPCLGLGHALAIGYDTHGGGFDRFSHIIVGPERCAIASLTPSEGPPRRHRKGRHAA
ncbi:MAG TPA: DUF6491 family protein [Allosphingosinicella sp.]|nr:DUF6491 family protein [Allosphingosinicella sp.]